MAPEFHCIVVGPITVLVAGKSEDKLTNSSVWALAVENNEFWTCASDNLPQAAVLSSEKHFPVSTGREAG
jgi:hypothetical protein